jgi:hypothetical protein
MSRATSSKSRFLVIYAGAPHQNAYRVLSDVAAKAWDAGSDVRVRRLASVASPRQFASYGDWLDGLQRAADVPEIAPADFAWATVVMVLTPEDRIEHSDDQSLNLTSDVVSRRFRWTR